MNEKRETVTTLEILGRPVEVVIYACPGCTPTGGDVYMITKAIERGIKQGEIESEQPRKETLIYGRWKVMTDELKNGDRIQFSTSGKYNPRFSTTNTYTGTVRFKTASGHWMVQTDDGGCAVIPTSHIEKLLNE